MQLHELKPVPGSTKRRKRIGRGIGSGHGKTATRGTKGQKARRQISPVFEGGQTPIHRRLPVKKGFRNVNHKEYVVVNLDDLEKFFNTGDQITPELLIQKGICSKLKDGIKLLAFGKLTKKLDIKVHRVSESAKAQVLALGGEVTLL